MKNITILFFGATFLYFHPVNAFLDVDKDSPYAQAIEYLETNGIVQGYADDTYRAENKINRYDFIKIIIGVISSEQERYSCEQSEYLFADVESEKWFSPYICLAKKYGIIKGYTDGMFRGQNPISFAEALKIVLEGYDVLPPPAASQGPWYTPYIVFARSIGLSELFLTNPDATINRGEMASLIYEMEKMNPKDTQDEPDYKKVLTTMFWVGEGADDSNGYISNVPSAWDGNWMTSFGGVDNPDDRCGYHPCGFIPKENPFYFALPYNDLDDMGNRKESAKLIPWFEETKEKKSILKNQWIEVRYNGKTCYGQWEDVGPFEEDDFKYVFGEAQHKNVYGVQAGIDLSPAFFTCLGLDTNREVEWHFVEENEIPEGPWKEIITTSDAQW